MKYGMVVLFLFSCVATVTAQVNPLLETFSKEFFDWRAVTQPATGDDIPRVERPDGWTPDFSEEALRVAKERYRHYRKRLDELDRSRWTRRDSIDYLLLSSAVERVNWELSVLKLPYRNPDFYVHQTLGVLYELLLLHSPWDDQRAQNYLTRMKSIPATLAHARENLKNPVKPFGEIAVYNLTDVEKKLKKVTSALRPYISASMYRDLLPATQQAAKALVAYRNWLNKNLSNMSESFSVGREGYQYFLQKIALIPYSPEQMIQMGRQEWDRAVAFEAFETLKNESVPPMPLFSSIEEQIRQSRKDEESIRDFLEQHRILSVPKWLHHYINEPIPDYLQPLTYMGVVDDLTSPNRLNEDAVSYIPEPSGDLSFFRLASAMDPRPIIVHEGIPGHYFQLALSWLNPDPIRRHFFDSGPNEGIAFYVEEMLLQFGLFDDRPHTCEIIYRFMRLRALRVEVDIQLALGEFSIQKAGHYLAKTVPMDVPTAIGEAGFFAYNPGQAISYQIGKIQILNFLADARVHFGDRFRLREFHDYLMTNGNVPIALLRWELLGQKDEISRFWE